MRKSSVIVNFQFRLNNTHIEYKVLFSKDFTESNFFIQSNNNNNNKMLLLKKIF